MRTTYSYVNGILDIQCISFYRRKMADNRDQRIITPMSRELICAIDDFRFDKRLASRSEAIRRLIELGLKAAEREKERT
jgi:hypothetical protein